MQQDKNTHDYGGVKATETVAVQVTQRRDGGVLSQTESAQPINTKQQLSNISMNTLEFAELVKDTSPMGPVRNHNEGIDSRRQTNGFKGTKDNSPQTAPGFGARVSAKRGSCDTSPSRPHEKFMSLERVKVDKDRDVGGKRASVAVGPMVRESNASGTVGLSAQDGGTADRLSHLKANNKYSAVTHVPTSLERTIDARTQQRRQEAILHSSFGNQQRASGESLTQEGQEMLAKKYGSGRSPIAAAVNIKRSVHQSQSPELTLGRSQQSQTLGGHDGVLHAAGFTQHVLAQQQQKTSAWPQEARVLITGANGASNELALHAQGRSNVTQDLDSSPLGKQQQQRLREMQRGNDIKMSQYINDSRMRQQKAQSRLTAQTYHPQHGKTSPHAVYESYSNGPISRAAARLPQAAPLDQSNSHEDTYLMMLMKSNQFGTSAISLTSHDKQTGGVTLLPAANLNQEPSTEAGPILKSESNAIISLASANHTPEATHRIRQQVATENKISATRVHSMMAIRELGNPENKPFGLQPKSPFTSSKGPDDELYESSKEAPFFQAIREMRDVPHMSGPHDNRITKKGRARYTTHTGTNGFSGHREKFTGKPRISNNLKYSMERSNKLDEDLNLTNQTKHKRALAGSVNFENNALILQKASASFLDANLPDQLTSTAANLTILRKRTGGFKAVKNERVEQRREAKICSSLVKPIKHRQPLDDGVDFFASAVVSTKGSATLKEMLDGVIVKAVDSERWHQRAATDFGGLSQHKHVGSLGASADFLRLDQHIDSAFAKRKESIERKSRRGFHLRDSLPRANDKMNLMIENSKMEKAFGPLIAGKKKRRLGSIEMPESNTAAGRIAAKLLDDGQLGMLAMRAGSELAGPLGDSVASSAFSLQQRIKPIGKSIIQDERDSLIKLRDGKKPYAKQDTKRDSLLSDSMHLAGVKMNNSSMLGVTTGVGASLDSLPSKTRDQAGSMVVEQDLSEFKVGKSGHGTQDSPLPAPTSRADHVATTKQVSPLGSARKDIYDKSNQEKFDMNRAYLEARGDNMLTNKVTETEQTTHRKTKTTEGDPADAEVVALIERARAAGRDVTTPSQAIQETSAVADSIRPSRLAASLTEELAYRTQDNQSIFSTRHVADAKDAAPVGPQPHVVKKGYDLNDVGQLLRRRAVAQQREKQEAERAARAAIGQSHEDRKRFLYFGQKGVVTQMIEAQKDKQFQTDYMEQQRLLRKIYREAEKAQPEKPADLSLPAVLRLSAANSCKRSPVKPLPIVQKQGKRVLYKTPCEKKLLVQQRSSRTKPEKLRDSIPTFKMQGNGAHGLTDADAAAKSAKYKQEPSIHFPGIREEPRKDVPPGPRYEDLTSSEDDSDKSHNKRKKAAAQKTAEHLTESGKQHGDFASPTTRKTTSNNMRESPGFEAAIADATDSAYGSCSDGIGGDIGSDSSGSQVSDTSPQANRRRQLRRKARREAAHERLRRKYLLQNSDGKLLQQLDEAISRKKTEVASLTKRRTELRRKNDERLDAATILSYLRDELAAKVADEETGGRDRRQLARGIRADYQLELIREILREQQGMARQIRAIEHHARATGRSGSALARAKTANTAAHSRSISDTTGHECPVRELAKQAIKITHDLPDPVLEEDEEPAHASGQVSGDEAAGDGAKRARSVARQWRERKRLPSLPEGRRSLDGGPDGCHHGGASEYEESERYHAIMYLVWFEEFQARFEQQYAKKVDKEVLLRAFMHSLFEGKVEEGLKPMHDYLLGLDEAVRESGSLLDKLMNEYGNRQLGVSQQRQAEARADLKAQIPWPEKDRTGRPLDVLLFDRRSSEVAVKETAGHSNALAGALPPLVTSQYEFRLGPVAYQKFIKEIVEAKDGAIIEEQKEENESEASVSNKKRGGLFGNEASAEREQEQEDEEKRAPDLLDLTKVRGAPQVAFHRSMQAGFDHLADKLRELHNFIERDVRERTSNLVKVAADARGISAEQAKSLMSGNGHVDQLMKVLEKLVIKDREVARRYGIELAGATGSAASSLASDPMESIASEEYGSLGADGTAEDASKDLVTIHTSNVGANSPKTSPKKKQPALVSDSSQTGYPIQKLFAEQERAQKFYAANKQYINVPKDCNRFDLDQSASRESTKLIDPMITYNYNCLDRNIIPQPFVLNLFNDGTLRLCDQFISAEMCECIADLIERAKPAKPKRRANADKYSTANYMVSRLIVDGCQLGDDRLAVILKALAKQGTTTSVTLMNCSFGEKSFKWLQKMFYQGKPYQIEELRFICVEGLRQDNANVKLELAQSLISANLRVLQLSGLELSSQEVADSLAEMLVSFSNKNLRELDLSYARMHGRNLAQIMAGLRENAARSEIETLSLRGITFMAHMDHGAEAEQIPEAELQKGRKVDPCRAASIESGRYVIMHLNEFILLSRKLTHLDISQMGLGPKLLDIFDAIDRSSSLLSVHLGGNRMTKDLLRDLMLKFKIRRDTLGLSQDAEIDTIEQIEEVGTFDGLMNTKFSNAVQGQGLQVKSPKKVAIDQSTRTFTMENLVRHQISKSNKQAVNEQKRVQGLTAIHSLQGYSPMGMPLILTRKIHHPELIFGETVANHLAQSSQFGYSNGFEVNMLHSAFSSWQLERGCTGDQGECYVCGRFMYSQVYFRRPISVSSADPAGWKRVTDFTELQQCRAMLGVGGVDEDLASTFPVMFGSMFNSAHGNGSLNGAHSAKMILAKHQAAVMAIYEDCQKQRDIDLYVKRMKTLLRAVCRIMRAQELTGVPVPYEVARTDNDDGTSSIGQNTTLEFETEGAYFLELMNGWRERLMPFDPKLINEGDLIINNQLTVNRPCFDEQRANENDIYIWSGYVRPGMHKIYVFDPVMSAFYRREDIAVYPVKECQSRYKDAQSFMHTQRMPPPEEEAKKPAAPIRGVYGRTPVTAEATFQAYQPQFTFQDLKETNLKLSQDFKSAQHLVYGEHLVNDFSRQVCSFISNQDIGDAADLRRVVLATRKSKRSANAEQQEEDSNKQEDDIISIEKAQELLQMFLLDFKYVLKLYAYYDVLRFKAAAERTRNKPEESRETVIHEDAKVLGNLLLQVLNEDFVVDVRKAVEYLENRRRLIDRKQFIKILFVLLSQRKVAKPNFTETMRKMMDSIRFFCHISPQDNDVSFLRHVMLFQNRSLLNMVLASQKAIERVFKRDLYYDARTHGISFNKSLSQIKMYFDMHQADEDTASVPYELSIQRMAWLAKQAQTTQLSEPLQMQARNYWNSMNLIEFTVFLVLLAIDMHLQPMRKAAAEELKGGEEEQAKKQLEDHTLVLAEYLALDTANGGGVADKEFHLRLTQSVHTCLSTLCKAFMYGDAEARIAMKKHKEEEEKRALEKDAPPLKPLVINYIPPLTAEDLTGETAQRESEMKRNEQEAMLSAGEAAGAAGASTTAPPVGQGMSKLQNFGKQTTFAELVKDCLMRRVWGATGAAAAGPDSESVREIWLEKLMDGMFGAGNWFRAGTERGTRNKKQSSQIKPMSTQRSSQNVVSPRGPSVPLESFDFDDGILF